MSRLAIWFMSHVFDKWLCAFARRSRSIARCLQVHVTCEAVARALQVKIIPYAQSHATRKYAIAQSITTTVLCEYIYNGISLCQWKTENLYIDLFSGSSENLTSYYHITLIVTVEQENAVVELFKEKDWIYVKAGKMILHCITMITVLYQMEYSSRVMRKPEFCLCRSWSGPLFSLLG